MKRTFIVFLLISMAGAINAQNKLNVKFGKVEMADFSVSSPVVDSGTNAVVLSDIGSTSFEGNASGWFTMVFKRHKRIKILNQKGLDVASFEIDLYRNKNGEQEQLQNLQAATYNIENGVVIVTKLENANFFTEKVNKNIVTKKFAFPAARKGSILEVMYTIKSDFLFNLQSWTFQGEYPCLWSEYEVSIPQFVNYVYIPQGHLKYNTYEQKATSGNYRVSRAVGKFDNRQDLLLSCMVSSNRWVIKDAPAIKLEPFTSSVKNHIAHIDFQLSEFRVPNEPVESIMGDWKKASETLLKERDFGVPISDRNEWLDQDLAVLTRGITAKDEVAEKLFSYVRDHFICTGYGIRLSEERSLSDVYRRRTGTVGEINLLLVAMLKHEQIDAAPVLLSTRDYGFAHAEYPLMNRYNYLVCFVPEGDSGYCLDASKAKLGFRKLPAYCYNGNAKIVSLSPRTLSLETDSLKETKLANVFIVNNEKGQLEGSVNTTMGYYESLKTRDELAKSNEAEYFKQIVRSYPSEIKPSNFGIDSLALYNEPVALHYDLDFSLNGEDILYFTPILVDAVRENQFKSLKRQYPVEMPYVVDDTYILNMEVPKGYKVEELPKSARLTLNANEGMFEYIVAHQGENIQLRCRLNLKKANYAIEDYDTLREFFANVVKKEREQIVFKKIK